MMIHTLVKYFKYHTGYSLRSKRSHFRSVVIAVKDNRHYECMHVAYVEKNNSINVDFTQSIDALGIERKKTIVGSCRKKCCGLQGRYDLSHLIVIDTTKAKLPRA